MNPSPPDFKIGYFVSRQEKCAKCGKYTKRKQEFYQIIGPNNRNRNGSIKNRDDILRDLRVEVDLWKKAPIYHEKCEVS